MTAAQLMVVAIMVIMTVHRVLESANDLTRSFNRVIYDVAVVIMPLLTIAVLLREGGFW